MIQVVGLPGNSKERVSAEAIPLGLFSGMIYNDSVPRLYLRGYRLVVDVVDPRNTWSWDTATYAPTFSDMRVITNAEIIIQS